ncbi:LORF2 protein, partial [Crocuta crocuta]
WKTVWPIPQNVKHGITIGLSNSTPRYIPKKSKTGAQTNTCRCMFTAALFTIVKRWKQPKVSSTDEWISKSQYIHTMKYYSAIKRSKIPIHATTSVNLENIILGGRHQNKLIQKYRKQAGGGQ